MVVNKVLSGGLRLLKNVKNHNFQALQAGGHWFESSIAHSSKHKGLRRKSRFRNEAAFFVFARYLHGHKVKTFNFLQF